VLGFKLNCENPLRWNDEMKFRIYFFLLPEFMNKLARPAWDHVPKVMVCLLPRFSSFFARPAWFFHSGFYFQIKGQG
jgi:hypothetical protein